MNNKLNEYIDTLFAGAAKTPAMEELKEEMLQNLIDKYNDLIAEGKTEQEAYDAAVASIGDISGLIDREPPQSAQRAAASAQSGQPLRQRNGLITAIAVALYVLCSIPMLFLENGRLGVTIMLCLIAAATGLLIWDNPKRNRTHAGLIAVGVMLYILCPVAVIALYGAIGPATLLLMAAAATGIIIYANSNANKADVAGADASSGGARGMKTAFIIAGCIVLALMIGFCASAVAGSAQKRTETDLSVTYGEDLDDLGDELDDLADELDDWGDHGDFDTDWDDDDAHKGAQSGAATAPAKDDRQEKPDKKQDAQSGATAADTTGVQAGGGSVPMAGVREIEIDWVAGSVRVEPGEGTDIVFTETSGATLSNAQTLRYRVKGNELSISFMESTWSLHDFFSFADLLGTPAKDLVVTIPAAMIAQGQLQKLEVNGVSAEIILSDAFGVETELKTVSGPISSYKAGGSELSVESTSGEITLSDFNVRKLDVEVVSGAAHAQGAAQKADLQTVSGDIDATFANAPGELEGESVSGTISVGLPAGAGDFTATHDAVSGDFICTFPTVQNGNRHVAGSGAARFEFESVSGDVRITPAA